MPEPHWSGRNKPTDGDGGGGDGGSGSLTDLTDVTGTPDPGTAPVYDADGNANLTPVTTSEDFDAILAVVAWHKVMSLDGEEWVPSNASVTLTPDGVAFGPYADGGAEGGTLRYHGLDGEPFAAVRNLAYFARYTFDSGVEPGPPYCRVFLLDGDGVEHSVAHTPVTEAYAGLGAGPFQEFAATSGLWRYDDDGGDTGPGVPLGELQAQYADHVVDKLTMTVGYTGGANLAALLRWWQVNGDHRVFGLED